MNNDTLIPRMSQQSNVTNWQQIDLSTPEGLRTLDRAIAPLAGWTCKLEGRDYWLRSPSGKTYQITPKTWCDTEEETIAHTWKNGWIPKYTTDVNAALEILPHAPFVLLYLASGLWRAVVDQTEFIEATPALAICKAWLTWHDVNGGQS